MSGRACCRTLFVISSGPGALSGASFLTASRICVIEMRGLYGTSVGNAVLHLMSDKSARGGGGKNVFWNAVTFSSCVVSAPCSVGIMACAGILVMYFLIWKMDLLSALFTYSFHLAVFALDISLEYSSASFLHALLSASCLVLRYMFLSLLALRLACVTFSFHHRLLWGLGLFRGVVSCTAFEIACVSFSV